MKAAVMVKAGELKVMDVPDLKPNAYQALVKISHCAICNGTDWSLLNGTFPPPSFPIPGLFSYGYRGYFPGLIGHESVGEVIEIGSKVTRYKKGDIVLRVSAYYPDEKPYKSYWGGFNEYGYVEDVFLYEKEKPELAGPCMYMQQVVPKEMDRAAATMLITLKEARSSLQGFGLKPRESLFIWGGGPVGQCFARWAKVMGAYPVILCDRHPERLEFAKKMGADFTVNPKEGDVAKQVMKITGGKGAQKVVNAIGDYKSVEASFPFLAGGGQIGIYGIPRTSIPPKPEETTIELGKRVFTWGPWNLMTINPDEAGAHQQVLDAVRLGLFNPKDLVTQVIPLAEIREGFELLKNRKAMKVVVQM